MTNAVFSRYLSGRPGVIANRNGGGLRDLGGAASLATIASSVSDAVSLVCRWGVPSEIAKRRIPSVVVIVTPLQSGRTLADERLKHKDVNRHAFGVSVSAKIDHCVATGYVPVFEVDALLEDRASGALDRSIQTPNPAKGGDFVEANKSFNRSPALYNFISHLTSFPSLIVRCLSSVTADRGAAILRG